MIRAKDMRAGDVLLHGDKPARRVQSVTSRTDGMLRVTSLGMNQGQYDETFAPDSAVSIHA